MRRRTIAVSFFTTVALLVYIAGCVSSGLSPREVRGQDYSTYTLALYEPPAPGTKRAERRPLTLPAQLAVAQVGEVAPPQELLDALRKESSLFIGVQPIPGIIDVSAEMAYHGQPADRAVQARRAAQQHIERLRLYARDINAKYLFIYGGTIDEANTSTGLALADLTIVGAFVVPSKRLSGRASAAGSLVDVETGQVVLSVSASADRTRLAATAAQDTGRIKMLESLRDEVVLELGEQLKAGAKAQSAAAVGG